MTRFRCTLLAALLLTTAAALPLGAQSVVGQLRAADTARPLPGARLVLIDAAHAAVDTAVTDRTGRFRLDAAAPGTYAIHFQLDGWAGEISDTFTLTTGSTLPFDFDVRLVAHAALAQMSDVIALESRLQSALPELCGEPFRAWEAGLLVGVVRSRATRQPIAGARVMLPAAAGGERATISSENGVYVLCNVEVGPAVPIVVETPDGTREVTDAEIRAGTASWYDLPVGPRRR